MKEVQQTRTKETKKEKDKIDESTEKEIGLQAEQRAVIQKRQLFWTTQTMVAFAGLVTTVRLTCMEVGCASESVLGRTSGWMKLSSGGYGRWKVVNLTTRPGYYRMRHVLRVHRPRRLVLTATLVLEGVHTAH